MDTNPLALAYDRLQKRDARMETYMGADATTAGKALVRDLLGETNEFITNKLEGPPLNLTAALVRALRHLDPYVIACCALGSVIHQIALRAPVSKAAKAVGHALQGELFAAGLLEHDAKLFAKIESVARARHSSLAYRRQSARSMADRAGFKGTKWSEVTLVRAGSWLIDCVLHACPDVFALAMGERKRQYLALTPQGLDMIDDAIAAAIRAAPVFLPCSVPPLPWTGLHTGGWPDPRFVGRSDFVRSHRKATLAQVRAAFVSGSVRPHADAVNSVQGVPWRINSEVLAAVKWAYNHNLDIKGLPSALDKPVPARMDDFDWEEADDETKQTHVHKISETKLYNRGLVGNRVLFAEDVALATELVSQPLFYTPTNVDWRGRLYPLAHFSLQRDDRVRGLFMFAGGMPIGAEGLYWLKVHTANCFGLDKAPFAERVAWAENHIEQIRSAAWDWKSEQAISWWCTVDKPFMFLASCLELSAATQNGTAYISTLPISFDGSCSGLQHLCAMTRAAEGAAVNLTPSDRPQDIYQTVADLVRTRVEHDAQQTYGPWGELARLCLDSGITRKLVKRNVMTYSYSSKAFGMAGQHREDTMRPLAQEVLEGKRAVHPYASPQDTIVLADGTERQMKAGHAASKYLAQHVYNAIEQVVSLPAQAMRFLQQCARALAHEGKPLSWVTPTGLPWLNNYYEGKARRVQLWLSDAAITMTLNEATPVIDKDRAANGVAPNFVHACDASHLALVVNAAVREGIRDLALVHDSFGCLAPQAPRFRQIIREQFVEMYESHDVLAEILVQAQRELTIPNHGRLPELPPVGPLNLKETLDANYAFA